MMNDERYVAYRNEVEDSNSAAPAIDTPKNRFYVKKPLAFQRHSLLICRKSAQCVYYYTQ